MGLALAFALAGCGEDEPEGPSQTEYRNQVNEVCSANAAEVGDIVDLNLQGKKIDSLEAQSFADQLYSGLDAMLIQMRQLDKPEEDAPDVERVIGLWDKMSSDARRAKLSERDSVAFVASLDDRIAEIDAAVRQAKLPNCGS